MVSSGSYNRVLVVIFLNMAVSANGECISLEDRFKETVWESNIVISDWFGNLNTSGTVDAFDGNPLLSGSVNGTQIGGSYGVCRLLPSLERLFCVGELKFDGEEESTITFSGAPLISLEPIRLAITAGTGCYEGAKGTLLVTPQDVNQPFDTLLWELLPPPDTSQCMGIASRFNGAPIFELSVTGTYIGEAGVAGGAFLWDNHELYAGSIDGVEVGESFGVCRLLPELSVYKCDGVIMFGGSDDFLTYSGLAPYDVNGTEMSAITGGTGCYEGERGELALTRRQVNEPGDYYQWDYAASSPSASCMSLDQIYGDTSIIQDMTMRDSSSGTFKPGRQISLWYNNPLRVGDIDGPIVGHSNGLCTLHPAAAFFMQCSSVFLFGDMGQVSVEGPMLDYTKPIPFAITGGTGCFENITGNIVASALTIKQPFDAFQLDLVGSSAGLNNQGTSGTSNGQPADSSSSGTGTNAGQPSDSSSGTGGNAGEPAESSPGTEIDFGSDSGAHDSLFTRGLATLLFLPPFVLFT